METTIDRASSSLAGPKRKTIEDSCRELAERKGYELKRTESGVEAYGAADGKRYGHLLSWNFAYNWLRSSKAKQLPLPSPPPPVIVPTEQNEKAGPRLVHSRSRRKS